MTTDLWMLVFSAVFCLFIPVFGVVGLMGLPGGAAWGFGNRDTHFPVPDWIARTRRAHTNLVENLAPFAILVLAAHVTGKANATTALGAQIFFVARVAHTGIYMIGIPYARTAVFFVGVAGQVLILLQLFG